MRILELIGGLGGGGAEGQLLALVRALRTAGVEVHVAALKRADGLTGQALRSERVPVVDLAGARPLDPRPLLRLRRLVARLRPDAVHSHLGRADVLAGAVCARAGVPHVLTRHSDFEPWVRTPIWPAYRATLRRARTIAVSEHVAGRLREWGATDVTTIRGLLLDPTLLDLPAPPTPGRRVGFLGRVDRVKGADLFVEVAARLLDARPDLEITLAGDGPLRRALQRRARALPIRWPGWVDRRAFLEQLDLLIVPSRAEGLGLSAAEALAAGRKLVATDTGGLPSLAADRPDALLAPPDPDALAAAALTLLDAPPTPRQPPALSLDPTPWAEAHLAVLRRP